MKTNINESFREIMKVYFEKLLLLSSQIFSSLVNAFFILQLKFYFPNDFNSYAVPLAVFTLSYAIFKYGFFENLLFANQEEGISTKDYFKITSLYVSLPFIFSCLGNFLLNSSPLWFYLLIPVYINLTQDFLRHICFLTSKRKQMAAADLCWFVFSILLPLFLHSSVFDFMIIWALSGLFFGIVPLIMISRVAIAESNRKGMSLKSDYWRRAPVLLQDVLLIRGLAELQILVFNSIDNNISGNLRIANILLGFINVFLNWQRLEIFGQLKSDNSLLLKLITDYRNRVIMSVIFGIACLVFIPFGRELKLLTIVLLLSVIPDQIVASRFFILKVKGQLRDAAILKFGSSIVFILTFLFWISVSPSELSVAAILFASLSSFGTLLLIRDRR